MTNGTSINYQLLDVVRDAISLGLVSDELDDVSFDKFKELMNEGNPVTFVTIKSGVQSAITFSGEGFLNSAGRKLTLEPYTRSNTRQIFSFRFQNCLGAIASSHQYGMVFDVASVDHPVSCPVYMFPFHGQPNQLFQYRDRRLYSVSNGKCVTFDREKQHFFMGDESESPSLIQKFGIIQRDI
jgi:hypothetical protein